MFGATVTEMMRTFRQQLFRLDDHLERLFHSLHYVGFDIGMSRHIGDVSRQLIAQRRRNRLDEELGLIHFITAGEYARYAGLSGQDVRTTPTVCAHTFPLSFDLWADRCAMAPIGHAINQAHTAAMLRPADQKSQPPALLSG